GVLSTGHDRGEADRRARAVVRDARSAAGEDPTRARISSVPPGLECASTATRAPHNCQGLFTPTRRGCGPGEDFRPAHSSHPFGDPARFLHPGLVRLLSFSQPRPASFLSSIAHFRVPRFAGVLAMSPRLPDRRVRALLRPDLLEERDLPSFTTPVIFTSGLNNPGSVAVGDFSGDGKPDLVVTNYGPSGDGHTAAVFYNNGTGGVTRPPGAPPPNRPDRASH